MTSSAELTASPAVSLSMWHKFALAFALLALADILFYDQAPGLSLPIFTAALVATSLLANHAGIDRSRTRLAAVLLVLGLLPAIEDLTLLSVSSVVLATISAIALMTNPAAEGLRLPVTAARQLLLVGPFRLIPDAIATLRAHDFTRLLLTWSIPLALGLVFSLLFAAANPVIEQWLDQLRPQHVVSNLSFGRPLFWLLMLSLIWPFIHLRWRQRTKTPRLPIDAEAEQTSSIASPLLNPQTVVRSLLLFNLLFAIQTALDGVYLWGHAALPDGMTYATYAHRGAYPLIVTALLAAAFVIIAVRSKRDDEPRLIRPLVYLWVGQNLLLVLSSIQRVHIYVQTYLLTHWRIAALIWMALVGIGLILIVVRIVLDRPTAWLVRMNLIALAATLYGCALVNFSAVIADYNVAHSREDGRSGTAIDMPYLLSLGPQALPAVRRAMLLLPGESALSRMNQSLLDQQAKDMANWRSWTFRGWRLQRYLDTHPLIQNPS
ncbi:conserved membrane protein of unknown function [Bradyrhizobium sp. ORS 285]|uniref:DUF4153 domain-containing protein n=1 Tax=Bradyrhizobium sp. ORS 285 TaxID=115808 RepID=UPI0002408EC9|nr:DUF4173 domain-containing protein [Bradyrhizobium sp. ORS 285]CCD83971.1 conserved membrane hypothetical protein; putative membrane protein [Bradyrhizobium sp. ORS 285]SMX58416.1 conserved membrane protein of unknown function [Bradyrhizobium sp. ORS 285]